jgi:glucokinase
MSSVIAVDLGGTKLSTAVVDSQGAVTFRRKAAVDRDHPERATGQIARAIRESVDAARQAGVEVERCGLIVPGIYYAATGNVWAPNLWGHEQVPLRAELERETGISIVADSDRAGYVLGEQWLGVARGLKDVVFLAVGTGIGAGIVSGGHLLRGAGDIAGAVGWFALTPVWQDQYRQTGCWETEAAGPGLARRLGASSAEVVVAAARAGDAAALAAVHRTAQYLGMGIANLVSLLNPEMIVLGGGLMQAADLFLAEVREAMQQWAQPVSARQVRIETTRLGEDAGLLGAAKLALDGESN